jgi:hypothetical protein
MSEKCAVNRTVRCLTRQKPLNQKSIVNDTANAAVSNGMAAGMVLFLLLTGLAIYIFCCFCYKLICEKCGLTPGILIWIPIVQLVPLLQVAQMPVWMIILLLIPFVNLVVLVVLFAKICIARGKSPWLVIMLFIPIVNLVFLPYLAFSE